MKALSPDSAELPVVVGVTTEETRQARGLTRTFVALRHRNFRLFWFGQLISLIGTWMQTTAQAWLVLELTNSAWWLGVVGALQFLPVLLFALFGGVLADRLPKRRVLLFTQSSAMLLALVLWILVATGAVQLWHVLILATLLGLVNALDMPTRQAFVVEMVGRDDLPNAVALNSSLFNMARIIGPGIGGILIAWLGVAPLFLLNGISFIAVIIGLAMIDMHQLHAQTIHEKPEHGRHGAGTMKSLVEGLAYVRNTPVVFLVIAVVGIVSLFGINFNVVLPLFATNVLNVGSIGFGFISATFGVGSLLSALWLAWGNKKPGMRQLLLGAIAFSFLEALFALSHLYLLSLVLIAGVGFAQIAFSALANTTLQTVTPDHLRGRVMSVYMMVFAGSTPLGNLFIGGLAHLYNAPIALLVGALLSLAAAVGGWILRKPAEKSLAESALID
ncbi:MAG TPA: MFS transporter [Ktedonobacteraceae bacterium]|jgi:MFS family permease|nr:MFS transporter [Ktedonobacteraceae bacterium]